jgi:hypothetical protein
MMGLGISRMVSQRLAMGSKTQALVVEVMPCGG